METVMGLVELALMEVMTKSVVILQNISTWKSKIDSSSLLG
jgi:hypothetical protein